MIVIDVTDLKEKYQLLSFYFSEQSTLLKNISTLPNKYSKHTNNVLDTIFFKRRHTYIRQLKILTLTKLMLTT